MSKSKCDEKICHYYNCNLFFVAIFSFFLISHEEVYKINFRGSIFSALDNKSVLSWKSFCYNAHFNTFMSTWSV